jgi:hypothetical protein
VTRILTNYFDSFGRRTFDNVDIHSAVEHARMIGRRLGMGKLKTALAGAAAISMMFAASLSHAAIVNISATSSVGATYTFGPGDYRVEWIGTADGGAYNAWNGSCLTGSCTSGWTNQFSATDSNDPGFIQVYNLTGNPSFSSDLASLAAYQAASTFTHTELQIIGGVPTPVGSSLISQPWIVHADDFGVITFRAGDGSPQDNFGGVSLRLTAVPEPQTWVLLILGFGLTGYSLRRRRDFRATFA